MFVVNFRPASLPSPAGHFFGLIIMYNESFLRQRIIDIKRLQRHVLNDRLKDFGEPPDLDGLRVLDETYSARVMIKFRKRYLRVGANRTSKDRALATIRHLVKVHDLAMLPALRKKSPEHWLVSVKPKYIRKFKVDFL